MGIHEHPQARIHAARLSGATADVPCVKPISAPMTLLAVIFGALVAVVMVCVMLGMVAARLVMAPGTWLGVVVVATLSKMAGWW